MQQPLKILAETDWFRLGPGTFETTFAEGENAALAALASELVDWRLLRYLQARDVTYDMPEGTGLAEAAEDAAPAPVAPGKGLILWQEYQRDQIARISGRCSTPGHGTPVSWSSRACGR
jgi:hypothetical protein